MKNKYILLIISFIFLINNGLISETDGEKYFKNNDPSRAVAALEKEIISGNITSDSFNYLGLAYCQLGQYENAVDAFARGLNNSKSNKKILSFNRGNAYYSLGKYKEAAGCYSLTLAADPSFTRALLNRGNAYLMNQDYDNVIIDYEKYLLLEPDDPQKIQIEEILALLKKRKIEMAEQEAKAKEEAKKQEEEQKRIQKELERQAEEEKQRQEKERIEKEKKEAEIRAAEKKAQEEEAERRRKLLEEVANSLQNSDSTNLSSGAEDIIEYDYESELD